MSSINFYKKPVPLEKGKHANLKLNRNQTYAFTSGLNSVPVAGTEFFQACRDYPIFFVKGVDEAYMPIAIVSLKQNTHDLGEHWEGVYVPAFVRRYPFVLTKDRMVLIDSEAPHFSEEEGEALFEEGGEPSPILKDVIKFLEMVDMGYQMTEAYSKVLVEKELLKPFDSTVKFDNNSVKLNDLYVIDEKKMHESLSAEEVNDWFHKGWIAWSHAHLHSLSSMGEVVKRHKPVEQAESEKKPADA